MQPNEPLNNYAHFYFIEVIVLMLEFVEFVSGLY